MTDFLLSPHAKFSEMSGVGPVSSSTADRSIFDGREWATARGGDYWAFTLSAANLTNRHAFATRAYLHSLAMALRGGANRIWTWDPSYTGPRGSFPATELLTNNTFASGTTGWSTVASQSVSDRVHRLKHIATGESNIYQAGVSLSQGKPYALRAFYSAVRTSSTSHGTSISDSIMGSFSDYSAPRERLSTLIHIPSGNSTATVFPTVFYAGPGMAGDYVDTAFTSLTPCFLIDNGPNLTLHSDDINNAAYTKTNASVVVSANAAPDGTATDRRLVEDSTAGVAHYLSQTHTGISASALDHCLGRELKQGTRTWVRMIIQESGSSHYAEAWFDLVNGVAGTVRVVGANMSNARAHVVNKGGGWFVCYLTARKLSSSTTMLTYLALATGDLNDSYNGDGSSYVVTRRQGFAQSSVPMRLVPTTTTVETGDPQTGNALYVKGGPTSGAGSGAGSLLMGDRVQIGNEYHILSRSLDFDSAGLGSLGICLPVKSSPADNAPVIVNRPMALCRLASRASWAERLGGFSSGDLILAECGE